MFQMCLGIPWGAPATPLAMQAMKDIMPKEGMEWFCSQKNEMPYVAQTVVMGGNPRVGLRIIYIFQKEISYKCSTS